jgi:hypothetical protein
MAGRTLGISAKTREDMRQISLSTTLDDERRWHIFTRALEGLLKLRIDSASAEPLARLEQFRLPQRHLGGGQQRSEELIWLLQEDWPIVALEEPEVHLHPGLARDFSDALVNIAPRTQFLISTHSVSMVDKATIENNWMLSINHGVTNARRIESPDDFRAMLHQLGVVPSDVLAKDFILFVEGGTESEAIVPAWAEKFGVELRDNMKIGVLSVGGENRLLDNLRIWLSVMEHAPAEYHIMVDSHVAGLVLRLTQELKVSSDRITVLSEHGIEDYYPPKLIVEALNAIHQIDDISIQKVSHKPRANAIRKILEENDRLKKGWKVSIATYVGSRMADDEIPQEFKDIVDSMRSILD